MHRTAAAPCWAIEADYPDPGVVEYRRPVGAVVCSDGREEVSIDLVQRVGDSDCDEAVQLSVYGMRWGADEARLMIRMMANGLALMGYPAGGESVAAEGDENMGRG